MPLDRTVLLEARPHHTTALDLAGDPESLWRGLREGDPETLSGDEQRAVVVAVPMRGVAR